jgi:hypothetical protein
MSGILQLDLIDCNIALNSRSVFQEALHLLEIAIAKVRFGASLRPRQWCKVRHIVELWVPPRATRHPNLARFGGPFSSV